MTFRSDMTLVACLGVLSNPLFGRIPAGIPIPQSSYVQATPGHSSLSDTTQGEGADHMIDVRQYGAVGDGVADDTSAMRAAIDAARATNGGVVYLPPGIYLTDALDCSGIENLAITGEGDTSILKRRAFSGTPLLAVGPCAMVCDLRLDGSKTSARGFGGGGDRGLVAAGDCIIDHVTSVENYGHGFRAEGNRNYFSDCTSEDNGITPGDHGTADGYYVRDPWTDNTFERCTAGGNSRSGFVITNMGTGCHRNAIISCTTDGDNGYNEVNLEGSTDSTVQTCTIRGLLIFNRAVRPCLADNTVTDGAFKACLYGRSTVASRIVRNQVETSDAHERIHVEGTGPRVEYNSLRYSRPPDRGYSIFVCDSGTRDTAVVIGNLVCGGCRGIYARGAAQFYDNQTQALANAARSLSIVTVSGRIATSPLDVADMEIKDSAGLFSNTAPPATGTFIAGDICRDMGCAEQPAWICVTGGTPGVWVAVSR